LMSARAPRVMASSVVRSIPPDWLANVSISQSSTRGPRLRKTAAISPARTRAARWFLCQTHPAVLQLMLFDRLRAESHEEQSKFRAS
jgi:hypothetical protein